MKTHQVTATLCQTGGYLMGIVFSGEARTTVKIYAPKLCQSAVLKAKHFSVCVNKTVLAGGLFVAKNKGNIHGHPIGICRHGNVARHKITSCYYS